MPKVMVTTEGYMTNPSEIWWDFEI